MQINKSKDINRFKIHINNAAQTINAEDVNKLGVALNSAESNVLDLNSESFKNKAFFALENNLDINALFLDDMSDSNHINHFTSINAYYNTDSRNVGADTKPQVTDATIYSTRYVSQLKGTVQKVILLVDDYIPAGGAINYYVATDDSNFMPIKKNQGTITEIKEGASGIIRADIRKNANNESPVIYGWALLYYDKIVDLFYNLKNIGLSDSTDLDINVLGDTILVRDPRQNDKLVAVIEGLVMTELYYRIDGRLDYVREVKPNEILKEQLNYGIYLYVTGESAELLMSTERTRETSSVPGV